MEGGEEEGNKYNPCIIRMDRGKEAYIWQKLWRQGLGQTWN